MGKFAPSHIHEWFSKWHWEHCNHTSWLTDIDRMWVEIRQNKIIAIFELKYPYDLGTYTENILIDFYENKNQIPFYILFIQPYSYQGPIFYVYRPKNQLMAKLSEKEMGEWIDNDIPESLFSNAAKPLPKEVKYLHEMM